MVKTKAATALAVREEKEGMTSAEIVVTTVEAVETEEAVEDVEKEETKTSYERLAMSYEHVS